MTIVLLNVGLAAQPYILHCEAPRLPSKSIEKRSRCISAIVAT